MPVCKECYGNAKEVVVCVECHSEVHKECAKQYTPDWMCYRCISAWDEDE